MRFITAAAVLAVLLGSASGAGAPGAPHTQLEGCEDGQTWESLILDHLSRYEEMQVADVYKLIHQATMGSEHAVPDIEVARQWLSDELGDLPRGPAEPLVDSLGAGGRVARIHLRPFVAEDRAPGRLLDAFVATASGPYGKKDDLVCAMGVLRNLAQRGQLPWSPVIVTEYLGSRAAEGLPAVHHSAEYERAYRPAYRVVAIDLVPQALTR